MKKEFENGSIVFPVNLDRVKKFRSMPAKILCCPFPWREESFASLAMERENKPNWKIINPIKK